MQNKRHRIILVISFILFLSLACTLAGSKGEPAVNAENTISTSVAATVAAGDKTSTPTQAVQPTVNDSDPDPDVDYQGVSFSFDDTLAGSVNVEIVPGQGDSNDDIWSYPDHRMFSFNSWTLADTFHTPAIRIYPIAEFRAINSYVREALDLLINAVNTQPVDEEGIAVADLFNAAQFIRSQVDYIQFQNGQGVRFLSQYSQAASPIGWPNLFYAFQGFTTDGLYFVSVILPVNHPSLPHPDDVTKDDAFYDNFMTYATNMSIELNGKDPGSFLPSLILLDEMIESLSIAGFPSNNRPNHLLPYPAVDFPFMFSYPTGWDIKADEFADSVTFSDPDSNTQLSIGRDWLCQGCLTASDVTVKYLETLEFQAEDGDFEVIENRPHSVSTGDDAQFSAFEWIDFDDNYHWVYSVDILVEENSIYFVLQGDESEYFDMYRVMFDEIVMSFSR